MTDDREHPGEGETAVPRAAEGHVRLDCLAMRLRMLRDGNRETLHFYDRGLITQAADTIDDLLAAPVLPPCATGESVVAKEDRQCSGECASAERGLRSTADPCVCRAAPVAPQSQPGAGGEGTDVSVCNAMRIVGALNAMARDASDEQDATTLRNASAVLCALYAPSPSSGDRAEGSAEAMRSALDDAYAVLASAFARIHSLPRTTDTDLAKRIGEVRAKIKNALALPARNEAAALASSGGREEGWKASAYDRLREILVGKTGLSAIGEAQRLRAMDPLSPTPPVAASEDVRGEVWQPIETAPRDYTQVIGINERGHVYRTWWFAPSSITRNWLRIPGNKPWEPTHWMPIQEPPAALTPPGAGQRSAEGEGK